MYIAVNKRIDMHYKEFLPGTVNIIILSLLRENKSMYGYEICQMTAERTDGKIQLTEGSIYPALHKMEKKGWIISEKKLVNGRTRKYYSIASDSSETADNKIKSLQEFLHIIQSVLKPAL